MKWWALLLGQVLAVLCTLTGVSGSLLVRFGISAPLFQLLWFYAALLGIFGTVTLVAWRRGKWKFVLRNSLLVCLASVLDTQANFLIIVSYSYTTVTSVSVLLQSSFLSAALFSYLFAKKRYTPWECAGIGVCLLGVIAIVLLDLKRQDWRWTGDSIGDVTAISGAILFSITSVFQEWLVQQGVQEYEYIAHISACGVGIIALEGWFLESSEILRIHTSPQVFAIALFAVSYTGMYAGMPYYLNTYGATLFNMSLIPNIVYTLSFAAVVYREDLDWMYVGGLGVVLAGLIMYNISEMRREIVRTPPLISSRCSSVHSLDSSIQ